MEILSVEPVSYTHLKLIHDPSQKVLAMYQAVIEFINEGCDINTLKVDVYKRQAGNTEIGRTTVINKKE